MQQTCRIPRWIHCVPAICTLLGSPAAFAQFTTLDPQRVKTHASATVSIVAVEQKQSEINSVFRTDFYAEAGFEVFSLYATLPVFGTLSGSPDEGAVGNLEIGGAHYWSSGAEISIVSHLGLVTPTASSNPRKLEVANAGSSGLIRDRFVAGMPKLWGLRFATSPRADLGILFLQGDLGFDFLFPTHESNEVGMRTSIGAGLNAVAVTLVVEIANAGLLSRKNSFDQTVSFGVTLNTMTLRPHLAYTSGLGDEFGREFSFVIGVSIGF